jgi:hypothetical protein
VAGIWLDDIIFCCMHAVLRLKAQFEDIVPLKKRYPYPPLHIVYGAIYSAAKGQLHIHGFCNLAVRTRTGVGLDSILNINFPLGRADQYLCHSASYLVFSLEEKFGLSFI